MRRRLLALAVVVVGTSAVGAPAAVPGVPALYVEYAQSCNFTLTVDPGTVITAAAAPGPTLPPGAYQLLTEMPNPSNGYLCPAPSFTLTGPGVTISIPFPGQALQDMRLLTLQPSATYVAEDENAPAATRKIFSTAATGSSTSLLPATTTTAPSGSQSQPDIVGSGITPYRGVLAARVAATGTPSLTRSGRRVATLAAGRYTVAVDDTSRRSGFFLTRGRSAPLTISSTAFIGRRRRTVTLTPGRWTYFSSAGKRASFTVSDT